MQRRSVDRWGRVLSAALLLAPMLAHAGDGAAPSPLEQLEAELHRQQEDIARQRSEIAEQQRRLEHQQRQLDEQRRALELLRAEHSGGEAERRDGLAEAPSMSAQAAQLPELPGIWRSRGDTHVGLAERFSVGLGIQHRLMFNASNIPGPADTTFSDTETYEFFRQRLRLNLSLAPRGVRAGGFMQAEFRGGFGGTSPNVSDPRGQEPTLNPFNQLEARGIRYGFLWAEPWVDQMFLGGILPMSDELGDTLFSADWDFNVGGLALLGARGPWAYRLAYLRLIDAVGSTDARDLADNGDLILVDVMRDVGTPSSVLDALRLGVHGYALIVGEDVPLGDTQEGWFGVSARGTRGPLQLDAFAVLNVGALGIGELDDAGQVVSGFDRNDGHAGYALKLGATHPLGPLSLGLQALYASGDRGDTVRDRFVTIQGLVGSEGYWAYTHVFTANAPSDVNDLAIDLGNDGSGLATVQGRVAMRVHPRVGLETWVGWFQAAHSRNGSRNMGGEVGAMTSLSIAEGLSLDVGAAGAFLGAFFDPRADDLFEVFTRAQFQY